MNSRTRSSGWKHAKLTGHENETLIGNIYGSKEENQRIILDKLSKPDAKIEKIIIGGLHEKKVDCIFDGEKTKSKTDMKIFLDDGSNYNISIKKSFGGQVFLIGQDRFISGFENQYNTTIPDRIKRGIQLFWGSAADTKKIIDRFGTNKDYEYRKNRLVAKTIKKYDITIYEDLLDWFSKNECRLVDFCFSKGLVKNSSDWADLIWYRNELGENQMNDLFSIKDLSNAIKFSKINETCYGPSGGGTTIQLAFGFVQWHSPARKIPGKIQFHHDYQKIYNLLKHPGFHK